MPARPAVRGQPCARTHCGAMLAGIGPLLVANAQFWRPSACASACHWPRGALPADPRAPGPGGGRHRPPEPPTKRRRPTSASVAVLCSGCALRARRRRKIATARFEDSAGNTLAARRSRQCDRQPSTTDGSKRRTVGAGRVNLQRVPAASKAAPLASQRATPHKLPASTSVLCTCGHATMTASIITLRLARRRGACVKRFTLAPLPRGAQSLAFVKADTGTHPTAAAGSVAKRSRSDGTKKRRGKNAPQVPHSSIGR